MLEIPTSLGIDPIVEAIAEIRFETKQSDGASTILGGGLYSEFKSKLPTFDNLPATNFPYNVRVQQGLTHTPLIRMGNGSEFILVGDNSLAYSVSGEYPGWAGFKSKIETLWRHADSLQCIEKVTRVALKYVNLMTIDEEVDHISASSIAVSIAGEPVPDNFSSLSMSFRSGEIDSVVQVHSNAIVNFTDRPQQTGLIISVDSSISEPLEGFWKNLDQILSAIHAEEKNQFFRLLSSDTLTKLQPRYN